MDTRKVVIRVAKKAVEVKKEEPIQKKKEPRPTTKEGIIALRDAGKRITPNERLFLDDLKYYNFMQNIYFMHKWFKKCYELGIKPNERLTALIEKDIAE